MNGKIGANTIFGGQLRARLHNAISHFLLVPLSGATAIIFGAAIGILRLATVPLTSGAVANIFGSRYLSTLYGIVMFSHQLGAFLGV